MEWSSGAGGLADNAWTQEVSGRARKSGQEDPTTDDSHIHLVWYCIQGCGARVTDTDKKLILDIFPMS
jgi:hypothetical protein